MELTFKRNVQIIAILLVLAAITQTVYTALYVAEMAVPRQLLWGTESFLFLMLTAFAGAAMLEARSLYLGWSALAFAGLLNVIQVGVGLTMFGPFSEAAGNVDALQPAASSVVAYSFMIYNAAKALIGLAAIVFGLAKINQGAKLLGGLTALVGAVALISNELSMAMGRDFLGELPLAGGSGVLATVLLAACLWSAAKEPA